MRKSRQAQSAAAPPQHPVSAATPAGLRQAVVLYEGKILDGRNRWLACQKIGLTAKTEQYQGEDPVGFVVSLNLSRRHLTISQKAAVGVTPPCMVY